MFQFKFVSSCKYEKDETKNIFDTNVQLVNKLFIYFLTFSDQLHICDFLLKAKKYCLSKISRSRKTRGCVENSRVQSLNNDSKIKLWIENRIIHVLGIQGCWSNHLLYKVCIKLISTRSTVISYGPYDMANIKFIWPQLVVEVHSKSHFDVLVFRYWLYQQLWSYLYFPCTFKNIYQCQ